MRNCLGALFITACYNSPAQPGISGPACIIPGTNYQYTITGRSDSTTRVCITGGTLSIEDTCIRVSNFPHTLFVKWKDEAANRKIAVTSSLGNTSLIVSRAYVLKGGYIEDSDKVQHFSTAQPTHIFHCQAATGGSCSPDYRYKWQISDNALNWIDIQGAVTRDLTFSGNISGNTFFRRVTTDIRSNTIAYSDFAQLNLVFQ